MQQLATLIAAATEQPELREHLEPLLEQLEGEDMDALAGTIRRLLDGERDPQTLLDGLAGQEREIAEALLQQIPGPGGG